MKYFYSKWRGRFGHIVKGLEWHAEEHQQSCLQKETAREGCKMDSGLQTRSLRQCREWVGIANTLEVQTLLTEIPA